MMNSELWISIILVIVNVKVTDAISVFDANLRAQYYQYKTIGVTNKDGSVNSVLGIPKDCKLEAGDFIETVQGTKRQKFKETFKNIPVADTTVEIDIDNDGNVEEGGSVGGQLIFQIDQDIPNLENCTLSADEAFATALDTMFIVASEIVKTITVGEIFVDENKKARLVWSIEIYVSNDIENKTLRHFFRIDRCNGEIAQYYMSTKNFSPRFAHLQDNIEEVGLWRNMRQATVTPMGTGSTAQFTDTVGTDSYTFKTESWGTYTDGMSGSTGPTVATDKPATDKPATDKPATSKPGTTKSTPTGTCAINVVGTGGNKKSGKFQYGVFPKCLDLKKVGDTCSLENDYVKVVDAKTTNQEDKTDVISYNCNTGYNDGVNGGYSPALDAFFHSTTAFKMLNDWYKYKPFKSALYVLVHFQKSWVNAMYGGGKLLFGDGDSTIFPLVTQDIVAHELGHGVTEQSSGLAYRVQSGGLDEAFCDIMGETAEAFLGNNDWMSGFNVDKTPKGALRFFEDPTRDGSSIKHVKDYHDQMDVHYSSGVINHMFYLVVVKQKVPIRYAFEAMLTANRMYWRENSNFEDAACGVLRATLDKGLDTGKFQAAFKGVGITGCALTKYMVKITETLERPGITVSGIRHPMFLAIVPSGKTSITVTVTAQQDVSLTLSKTLSMATPLVTGTKTVTTTVTGIRNVYIRLGGEKQSKTTASLKISYT